MDVLSSRTIIHPSDLERSLAFYGGALDLPVAREFGEGAGRGVVFFAGGGLIEVVAGNPAGHGPPTGAAPDGRCGPMLALWLQVRDIGSTVADLSSREVDVVRAPKLEPWGLIEAWIDDPDQLRIHLVEVPADHPLRRDQRSGIERSTSP